VDQSRPTIVEVILKTIVTHTRHPQSLRAEPGVH